MRGLPKRRGWTARGFQFGFMLGMLLVAVKAEAGYDYRLDTRQVKMGQFESEISSKFVRGVTNIVYGWTEIMRTPVEWAGNPEHGFLPAVFVGFPYGIFRFVGRTLVGVYEVTTCYAPQKPIFSDIQGDVL